MDSARIPPRPGAVIVVPLAAPTARKFGTVWCMLGYLVGLLVAAAGGVMLPNAWIFGRNWIPVPVMLTAAALAFASYRYKAWRLSGLRLEFGPVDFSFHDASGERFRARWESVTHVRSRRGGLTIVTTDGAYEMPEVYSHRPDDLAWFMRLIEPVRDREERIVPWWIPISCGSLGTLLLVTTHASAPLELGVTPHFWLYTTAVALGGVAIMATLIMLVRNLEVWIRIRDRIRAQPTYFDFVRFISPDLKPEELVAGRRYRYVDPRGLRAEALTITPLFWCFLAMAAIGFVVMFVNAKNRFEPLAGGVGAVFMIAAVLLYRPMRRELAQLAHFNDTFEVVDGNLSVFTSSGEVHDYVAVVVACAPDGCSRHHKPFVWWEEFGEPGNTYRLDRRYLVRVEDQA